MFNGIRGVLYRDLHVYRKRARKQVLAASVSPLLFLVAFGWGLGDRVVSGMPYITFLLPGLITMASMNQSYGIAQEINITRFYFHIYDEYLIAPVRSLELALGEVLYGIFRGLISTALIFLYALLFKVKLLVSAAFFPALVLHTFLFASLGTMMAMVVRDHGSQATVNTFVITPMIFLCGTFFPVDKLPYVFKVLVYLLPLTYSTKVIRASLTGQAVNPLYILIMLAYAGVFFVGATIAIRKVEA